LKHAVDAPTASTWLRAGMLQARGGQNPLLALRAGVAEHRSGNAGEAMSMNRNTPSNHCGKPERKDEAFPEAPKPSRHGPLAPREFPVALCSRAIVLVRVTVVLAFGGLLLSCMGIRAEAAPPHETLTQQTDKVNKERNSEASQKPAKVQLSKREKRMNRWVLVFNTNDGDDYLRQLRAFGAFLAIDDGYRGYLVIRDLEKKPVVPKLEDVTKIDRFYWIDDQARSIKDLSKALGLGSTPPFIIAFFPAELEKELADKELAAFPGEEDDIKETVFTIRPTSKRSRASLGASTLGLLGSPPGRGPILAAAALIPGRIFKSYEPVVTRTEPKR
jgi:hypothetical protein